MLPAALQIQRGQTVQWELWLLSMTILEYTVLSV